MIFQPMICLIFASAPVISDDFNLDAKYGDSVKQNRQSIRLYGYDYSRKGAYFITICAKNRQCLFGKIADDKMVLNKYDGCVKTHFR